MTKTSRKYPTVGLELEWADVNRLATIDPTVAEWNERDYSIVNSDGRANCPRGEECELGGEINTRPTRTAEEQGAIVRTLASQLRPTINYKCNTHVHVRPAVDLLADLNLLKSVAQWMRDQERIVYDLVDPLPPPTKRDYPNPEHLRGARKRRRRDMTSHHHRVPEERWREMMSATTPTEFYDAHAPPTAFGRRAFHITPRAGMNLRSLWKHGTIEFRHFHGTCDPNEATDAAEWCLRFVDRALSQRGSAIDLLAERKWRFPEPRRYEHSLQLGFELTRRDRR